MEGVSIDPLELNPANRELPINVSFLEPRVVEGVPADLPVLNPQVASLFADGRISCPLGIIQYTAEGYIEIGAELFDVISVCSIDDEIEGRKRIIIGSNDFGTIMLKGTIELNQLGVEVFVGFVQDEIAVDADPTREFQLL